MEFQPVESFKIGIADHSAETCLMVKTILDEEGYSVSGPCKSANEALHSFSRDKPDLILLDVHLEGEMDGIELGQIIYQQLTIPILYLLDSSDKETLHRAVKTSPLGFILKPFDPNQLKVTLIMAKRKLETDKQFLEYQQSIEKILQDKNFDIQREIDQRKNIETFLIQRNKELIVVNKELKLKNQQIMAKTLKLYQKDQVLKTLIKFFLDKKASGEKISEQNLDKIIQLLQEHFEKSTLDEFEVRFSDIYQGFNDRLLKSYPTLTPNEVRLCELIKLNFTTKDISNLTSRSLKSIEIARYRLRKKLGLGKYVDLAAFLANF